VRHAIVPSQITTLEDRLTANLTVTQAALIVGAILAAGFVFTFVDPAFKVSVPKIIIATVAAIFFLSLALRVKDKLVLRWVGLMLNYLLRPRFYVLTKDYFLREERLFVKGQSVKLDELIPPAPSLELYNLPIKEAVSFKFTKNGRINVSYQRKV
jgi:Zn-dependent protease with chaperone function